MIKGFRVEEFFQAISSDNFDLLILDILYKYTFLQTSFCIFSHFINELFVNSCLILRNSAETSAEICEKFFGLPSAEPQDLKKGKKFFASCPCIFVSKSLSLLNAVTPLSRYAVKRLAE
jgi:hypothetical protein